MTTSSTTTAIAHANDTDFQTWITELSGQLDAAGLAVAGDTGQINLATATRPAANTSGGYQIRYFNDSLHATKPCYFKIEFGSASTGRPQIWITAASGTNGAGTVSGTTYFSRTTICPDVAPGAGTYFTGVCVKDGYFGLMFKLGSQASTGAAFFFAMRTCDSSGTINNAGFHFYYPIGYIPYRYTYTTASFFDQVGYALYPSAQTTTLVSGSPQVFRHFGAQPQVQCVPFLLSFYTGEIGDLSTFTATPVGATQRTYLAFDGSLRPTNCGLTTTATWANGRLAMQWD